LFKKAVICFTVFCRTICFAKILDRENIMTALAKKVLEMKDALKAKLLEVGSEESASSEDAPDSGAE
jgi:hypothetical protein